MFKNSSTEKLMVQWEQDKAGKNVSDIVMVPSASTHGLHWVIDLSAWLSLDIGLILFQKIVRCISKQTDWQVTAA